jgi:hypothetical protein
MTRHVLGRVTAALGLAALLAAPPALAGSITINMSAAVSHAEGALTVVLNVSNTGDEAARSVVPILRFRDEEARGTRRDALAPNEKLDATLTIPVGTLGPGRYPYRVAVDYTDANQYPFQALHVGLLIIGDPSPAKIAVTDIVVPELSRSTSVRMKVKNLAGVARTATVTLFTPDDIEATEPSRSIELAAWAEAPVRIDLTNRTALAGSRYPLFVAAEYDDEAGHQAVIAQSIVAIISPRAFVSQWLWWIVGGLVVGWLLLIAWRMVARRRV